MPLTAGCLAGMQDAFVKRMQGLLSLEEPSEFVLLLPASGSGDGLLV